MKEIIEKVKEELLKAVPQVRAINKNVPVSGTRQALPLEGRNIEIVYYNAPEEGRPLMLGFHGGGFIMGGGAMDDNMWTVLAKELNFNIASVDYRMVPEAKWPAAVLDGYDTAVYLIDHADEYGFDKENVYLMGSSAGGNIAAATAIYAARQGKNLFKGQILYYPFLDFATDQAEKGEDEINTTVSLVAMKELYIDEEYLDDSTASPVCATEEELKALPPTICFPSEYDVLKVEAQRFMDKLQAAGVRTETHMIAMPHGFVENAYAAFIVEMFRTERTLKAIEDGSMKAESEKTFELIRKFFQL